MKIPSKQEIEIWWESKKDSLVVKQLIIVTTVLVFMSMAFLIAALIVGRGTIKEQTERETETLVYGVETSIDRCIDSVKSLSRSIMIDDDVVNYLKLSSVDAGITNDTRYAVMKILNAYSDIDSVFVIRNDGTFMNTGRDEYVFYDKDFTDGEWKEVLDAERGGAVICIDGNYTVHKKDSKGNLSVARAVYDLNSQKRIGYLIINISESMLQEVIRNRHHESICIVSDRGSFLAGNEELTGYFDEGDSRGKLIEIREKNDNQFVYKYRKSDAPLEIICGLDPVPMQIPATIMAVFAILIVAVLASMFLFGYFIHREISSPIYELINSMEGTKSSGWLKNIDVKMTSLEFRKLSDVYNSLIDYLNDLIKSLLEKEKAIQRAEMRVLQEQIKPHFLYNSLETISYMALEDGADDVHNALDTLGSFYRNFLSKGDRMITLEREVRIVKDYLSLQKLRYGDIIFDEYDIEEETRKCIIPKLMLQPLVENSIYHGIRPLGEPGIIRISSTIEEDKLKITVMDTGAGMTEDVINGLFSKDKDKDERASVESGLSGFGLRGTIERIRFYSNSDDAVQIYSEPGEFTKIDIYIPLGQE